MYKSNGLEKELDATRRKWLVAKKRGDTTMCLLWEKVGKSIKERIAAKAGVKENINDINDINEPASNLQIENIFGAKLIS